MYRFLLLCIAFCAFTPLDAQASEVEKIVSVVKVYAWNAKKRVWAEGRTIKRITRIDDRKGRTVSEILAGGADDLLEKSLYAHNGGAVTVSVHGPDGALRRTLTIIREGNLETETAVLADGAVLYVNRKTYSRSGLLAETLQGGADGGLVYRKTYEYDVDGNLTSVSVRNPGGGLAFVIDYKYLKFDSRGRWTARAEYYTYADVRRRPHEVVYRTFVKQNDE